MGIKYSFFVFQCQKCEIYNKNIHQKALQLYKLYLCVGGMPEVIKDLINNNNDILKFDRSIIEDIQVLYLNDMNKHVQNKFELIIG